MNSCSSLIKVMDFVTNVYVNLYYKNCDDEVIRGVKYCVTSFMDDSSSSISGILSYQSRFSLHQHRPRGGFAEDNGCSSLRVGTFGKELF